MIPHQSKPMSYLKVKCPFVSLRLRAHDTLDSLASDFDYDNYEDESDCLTGSLLKLRKRRNCQIAEITDYEVSLEGLKTNINNAMSITETLSQAKAAAVPDIVTIEDLQTQQTGAIKAIQESANDLPTKEAAFGDHLGKITGNPKIPEEFNADVDPSQELKLPDFQIKNRAFDANLVEVADGSDLQIKVRTSEGKLYSDAEWRAITAMVSTSVYISSVATTAGSDVPDDDDLPDECNPNPPQPSPTDVNLPKKSNKWCSASFKNMKFPQPQVDWTKQSTTHSASASAYQITGTLVIVCNPPKDVTKDTALTDKVSTTFMDTSEDAPTSENACMKATDTYAQPYVKMTAGAEYTLFGGGEVDIDFEVDVGIQATSIEDVESDQPTSSGDMSPSVDVIVTKVASSIKDVNAKATFELVLGYKEVIAGQDFLDIGLDTTISATLTAAQLSGDLVSNSGDSASSVSSSSIATTLSTVVLSATSTTTQVTATSSSAVPSASETPGIFCLTQVNVSGGIASAFFVKFMSKQVFNKDLIQSGVADAKTTFGTDICSQISDASLS